MTAFKTSLLALLVCALSLAQTVTVELLNLSDAPFGPVLVATHTASDAPLFDPATPPDAALRLFAEGSPEALQSAAGELARRPGHVRFGATAGPGPGESVIVEIAVTPYHRNVSLVAGLSTSGFAGFQRLHVHSGAGTLRHDVIAWEVAETVLVHRSRPSPIARAWVRYNRPEAQARPAPQPSLTASQAQARADCLAGSATCIWRLENGRGHCADCLPPLRPNAARTHCVE